MVSQHNMAVIHSDPFQCKRRSVFPPGAQFYIVFTTFTSLLMRSGETLNCTEPTTQGLLNALRQSVFDKTEVRPVINLQTPTNITLDFYIYGILGVDEKGQVLDVFIWLEMYWTIEGLSWDSVECGASRISVPRTSLWMPDIVINEFMDENKVPPTFYVFIHNTGLVLDSKPFHVISSCNLNIYTFPFDIQNCSYTFNSYLHPVSDVQIFFADKVKDAFTNSLSTIGTNGEWELIDLIPEKPEKDNNTSKNDKWDQLIFHIVLKRKAALYVVNLLLPSCFLVTLDVFSFLLPAQHVDRSAFKMTLILGYTVFLLLMNSLLPSTGNNIPLINVFFSLSLALMVGSLMETIFITNILYISNQYPRLPKWIRVLFLHYLARLVLMKKSYATQAHQPEVSSSSPSSTEMSSSEAPQKEEMSDTSPVFQEPVVQELRNMRKDLFKIHEMIKNQVTTEQYTEEWIHLGLVIDRSLFLLYVIFICVSFVIILFLWVCWYSQPGRSKI